MNWIESNTWVWHANKQLKVCVIFEKIELWLSVTNIELKPYHFYRIIYKKKLTTITIIVVIKQVQYTHRHTGSDTFNCSVGETPSAKYTGYTVVMTNNRLIGWRHRLFTTCLIYCYFFFKHNAASVCTVWALRLTGQIKIKRLLCNRTDQMRATKAFQYFWNTCLIGRWTYLLLCFSKSCCAFDWQCMCVWVVFAVCICKSML